MSDKKLAALEETLKDVEAMISMINADMVFAPTSRLDALEEREARYQSRKVEIEKEIEKLKAK